MKKFNKFKNSDDKGFELRPEKEVERDQHFLINEDVLKKEIEISNISEDDKIIEIGSGRGILTEELSIRCSRVLSFEIDKKFKKELEKIEKRNKNIIFIFDNALNYNWKGYNKLVSNIPYSLSEPVMNRLINSEIKEAILIVGENFKNLLMFQKTKVGILTNIFFKVKPIMFVGRECFNPSPRIDSWLIKMTRREKINSIQKIMQDILRKEGKLKNSLLYALINSGKTKNQSREMIKLLNISPRTLEKNTKKLTGNAIILIQEELQKLYKSTNE
ncbi:MAG TPA: rRNA adenine N-6-methyltransferase family protein [Candidatus Paceibacterota bacterium]|nr:rRNA adenine N-6-methyltransferase family protein [Candidatus Paceibacterota bacterium]